MNFRSLIYAFSTLTLLSQALLAEEPHVNFSRDVLPILSDRCLHCHGRNVEEGDGDSDLRLDQAETATADRGGYAAIVPGDPDASALVARVSSHDPDQQMPPPSSHRKPLSAQEIAMLRTWIQQGAEWGVHWAFQPPVRSTVPEDVHAIDHFVKRKLATLGLAMSDQAQPHTLMRRMSFDIIGLPPTSAELNEFSGADGNQETERYIDRLLQSPHYGERMAMWWLDVSRYADTDGYQGDATRTNWPWRDWVIDAFNRNMPFDQFTIEQFAGDLLDDATLDQQLATCFHRNHMTNGEGGRHPEESRIDYVIDRVNTTGTVWLGLTLGCAQCHSHKFDPISQSDYYRLSAFFNSIDEDGKAGSGAKPFLQYQSANVARAVAEMEATAADRTAREAAARTAAEAEFDQWLPRQLDSLGNGFQPWHPLTASRLDSAEGTTLTHVDDGIIQASGASPFQDDYRILAASPLARVTGIRLEVFPHESHTNGKLSRGKTGEFILTDVKLQLRRKNSQQLEDIEFADAVADAEKDVQGRAYGKVIGTLDDDPRNGWTTEEHDPLQRHVAVFALAEPLELGPGEQLLFVMLHRSTFGFSNIGRFRVSVTNQPGKAVRSLDPMPMERLADAGAASVSELDNSIREELLDQFLHDHRGYQRVRERLLRARRQLGEVKKAAEPLSVMVLSAREEPRETHVLVRGVWDQKGEVVRAAVPPAVLARPEQETRTRLDLARWIVSRENPLTARVTVNHLWQLFFGAGLVRTPEDFGLQGEQPTHPELLDWLAVELIESDWNLRHIIKLIVTSETYQQRSELTGELLELDPDNRLLARAPRFRLPSWMLRDAALRSSGLLNPAIGGPPVRPYQPDGVWAEIFMGRFRYEPSEGAAQYRRTLYAFWRRSSSPAFLFDNAMRQACEVRTYRTNTPLHALNLLNDETRLQASYALAKIAMESHDPPDRLQTLFSSVLSRSAEDDELEILMREYHRAREHYQLQPDDAEKYLDSAGADLAECERRAETAALMVVASMVLNLDEAITHE